MKRRDWILIGGIALVAAGGSLVASSRPDGLERVAEDLGFSGHEQARWQAPMPDYEVPGAPARLGGVTTGLVGAAATGLVVFGLGRWLARARRS